MINLFVNFYHTHIFNKLTFLTRANGEPTNRNRKTDCRIASTDSTTRKHEAHCRRTGVFHEVEQDSTGQEAPRRSLFNRKAFLQRNRESKTPRSKERLTLSLPFFYILVLISFMMLWLGFAGVKPALLIKDEDFNCSPRSWCSVNTFYEFPMLLTHKFTANNIIGIVSIIILTTVLMLIGRITSRRMKA